MSLKSNKILPEDVLSDESSFYGDDDTKADFEERAANYDGQADWLEFRQNSLAAIAYKALHPPKQAHADEATNLSRLPLRKHPHPHDGKEHCWQIGEPINEFTSRLRPSRVNAAELGPWIRVRNPFTPDGVDESDSSIAQFVSKGTQLLHDFEDEKADLEAEHAKLEAKSTAPLTRRLNVMRKELEKDLLSLARTHGVVVGKWMFFEPPGKIDNYWTTIATSTSRGELGIEAKVATAPSASSSERVICVYTYDCEDRDDVCCVLEKLVKLGLVKKDQRPIYYKCDAWTYLDIKSNNPWGLKASMYSSKDILQSSK